MSPFPITYDFTDLFYFAECYTKRRASSAVCGLNLFVVLADDFRCVCVAFDFAEKFCDVLIAGCEFTNGVGVFGADHLKPLGQHP
jgi:hypothetical protein